MTGIPLGRCDCCGDTGVETSLLIDEENRLEVCRDCAIYALERVGVLK